MYLSYSLHFALICFSIKNKYQLQATNKLKGKRVTKTEQKNVYNKTETRITL